MTAKQELELGRRVQKGCQKARTEFIQRNLKLVISLAGRYRGRGLDVADLVEEGNIGLIRAVNQEDRENVAAWLNLLPDLPRMVVMRRYVLDGRDSETLSAIGERLETTRERVRQIQAEALRLLRRMVESGRIPADAAILS
jgi:DNA-directed RNA polymerase sigma subunit (sigma70/sigma32)